MTTSIMSLPSTSLIIIICPFEYHSTATATATAKSIETVAMMSEIGARGLCLHQGMLGQGQGIFGAVVDG